MSVYDCVGDAGQGENKREKYSLDFLTKEDQEGGCVRSYDVASLPTWWYVSMREE